MGNKKSKKAKDGKTTDAIKTINDDSSSRPIDFLRIDQQINYIVDRFNYQKVHEAMVALDWVWAHPNQDENTVPTIERLISTSRYLLVQAATGQESVWATGGFMAQRYGDGTLHLSFYVSECSVSPDLEDIS